MPRSAKNLGKMDRDALHEYLWKKSNSRNRIQVHQGNLAKSLWCCHQHLNALFQEMVAQGRLRKLSKSYQGVEYLVKDPQVWREEEAARTAPVTGW